LVDQRRSVLLSGVCRAGAVDRPRHWTARNVIGLAAAVYILTVIYFLLCSHYEQDVNRLGLDLFGSAASTDNGYENSLMRWLLYLNPAARLGEFIGGLTAAHVYLVTRQRSAALGSATASAMTLIAIALTVGLHLWLYGVIAPGNPVIVRTASQLSAPLVAVTVYLIARYETTASNILSLPLPVRLGAASYSIYMLHEIVPSAFRRLGLQSLDIAVGWVTWTGALVLLVLFSSVSYALIEHPARAWLRALLAPRGVPVLTAQNS
jgi:peptidoglycan/LPS O-acetylase OafA/YrhL